MTRLQITAQQHANLREAADVMWPSVPESNVAHRLASWREARSLLASNLEPPTCGTVACFGGWCAWWPGFVRQGLGSDFDGTPILNGIGLASTAAHRLFGDAYLFSVRGQHPADAYSHGGWDFRTDHQIVAERLRWALANSEVVE